MTNTEVPVSIPAKAEMPFSIARRAARGSIALLLRQALTLLVTLIGGVLLARLLSPAQFGSYALIVFVSSLTKLLVDGGLGASLIQQKLKPTRDDRAVVFSFQLVLAIALAFAIILIAPSLELALGSIDGTALALSLSTVAVVAAPFTSISFVILERELKFGALGILMAIQPVFFNILAVWLASSGFGVISFGIALAVSNLLVVPAAIVAVREFPMFRLRIRPLRDRLRFSLPFIGTNLISTIKDAVNPLFIGLFIGASAVGYVNWAQQVTIIGLYMLVVVSRVLFPVFARTKDEPDVLPAAVSKVLFWANMMVAPIAVFLALFTEQLTVALYGNQWLPAVPLLWWLLLTNLISPTSSVLMALLNAIGRPSISFWFALSWFIATWALVPVFVGLFGILGYGIANALTNLISIAIIPIARKYVKFSWVRPLALPWIYTFASFAAIYLPMRMFWEKPPEWSVLPAALVALLILFGITWLFSKSRIQYLWGSVFS